MTRLLCCRGLAATIGAFMLLASSVPTVAQEFRHGLSTFGDLKYPADFKHFDYVNPDAPKGGRFSTYGGPLNSFDTFNPFILKGDPATGVSMLFDSLMARAADEPDSMYGLVAKEVAVAPDRMSVTFRLRPEAKFSDGSPITADDVVFSFDTLKAKGAPCYRITLRDVVKAEALDPHTVRYSFQGNARARPADGRCRSAGAVEGLLFEAGLRADDARAATRLGRHTGSPTSGLRARSPTSGATTTGRRICRSIAARTTSTRSASSTIAIARRRSKA